MVVVAGVYCNSRGLKSKVAWRDEFRFIISPVPSMVMYSSSFITKWRGESVRERAGGWQKFTIEIKNNGSSQNDTLNTIQGEKEAGEWVSKWRSDISHQFKLFRHLTRLFTLCWCSSNYFFAWEKKIVNFHEKKIKIPLKDIRLNFWRILIFFSKWNPSLDFIFWLIYRTSFCIEK